MNLNAYLTMIRMDIRLALRQRIVIFFSFLMPLAFFVIFAQLSHAERGGAVLQIVAMVTVIGTLGAGLMGAGIRAAQERETNILRRYKVAPITPLPLLVASTVTGIILYLPYFILMLFVAKAHYGMTLPEHLPDLFIFVVLGVLALRSIGLIVASVVNSMQESAVIVQIIYMAMMFLSGATIPIALFPNWLAVAVQYLPATWLMSGLQGIMVKNETLAQNWQAVGAMLLTTVIGLFLCVKLFRWEKEEKMRPAAKLWLVAVLVPFVVLGSWQVRTQDNVRKTKIVGRELARSRTLLVRGARIFIGNGKVIENGGVLVANGKVAEVYDGNVPDPKAVKADPIEAAGKTVLPGLIDTWVNVPSQRDLAAYLYCGVTAVNTGDRSERAVEVRNLTASGEKQGAELFMVDFQRHLNSLSANEAQGELAAGKTDLLNDSLVQQVGPPELLAATMKQISAHKTSRDPFGGFNDVPGNLVAAYREGHALIVATGAGQPLVFAGPSVQHEIELWVAAGIPAPDALRAATLNGAKVLHADQRIGSIEKGKDATMLIVDGNPLQDIKATEAVSIVIFKGELVNRVELFKPE